MALAGLVLAVFLSPGIALSEGTHSLDSVPVAEPVSLDSVLVAEPTPLDAVAKPVNLNAVPVAEPTSLDAVRFGKSLSPDDVPIAQPTDVNRPPLVRPDDLDAADLPAFAAPDAGTQAASVPPHRRDSFVRARKTLAVARARLDAANAAYSKMLARSYPRGEAKVAILAERDGADAAYAQAAAEFRDLGGEVPASRAER